MSRKKFKGLQHVGGPVSLTIYKLSLYLSAISSMRAGCPHN